MGAQPFKTVATGDSIEEAYKNACEQARAYNGHRDGYSGDIQTKCGWNVIPATEVNGNEPRAYADKLIHEDDQRVRDKRGPAGVIALGDGKYLFFGWAAI